jgi:hypothetical protein
MIMDFDQLKDAEERGFNPYASSTFTPFTNVPALPAEPVSGMVLGFTKRYTEDGPTYSFAAVRATARTSSWYLTGPNYAGEPMDWPTLLDFIGGLDEWRAVGVVATWTPLVTS